MRRSELRDPCRVVIRLMVSQLLLDAANLRFEVVDAVLDDIGGGAGFRGPAGAGRCDGTTGFAWLGRNDRAARPLPAPEGIGL